MPTTTFSRIITLSLLLLLSACDQQPDSVSSDKLFVNPQLPDFAAYTDVKAKKQAFFSFLQPLIKQANDKVLAERNKILHWQEAGIKDEKEQKQLNSLLKKYRVKAPDLAQQLTQLHQRVNVIPSSLVLAQAANESAWGTSRFAKKANNLFGQWCFSKGCGIVPAARNSGANHEVAAYDSPYESVVSYIRNLNSHPSYLTLRQLRNQQISEQGFATGSVIAGGLLKYSERGEEYVKEIRAMIRHNQLEKFDGEPETSQPQG